MNRSVAVLIALLVALGELPTSARGDEPFEIDAILPMTGQASFIGSSLPRVSKLPRPSRTSPAGSMGGPSSS